MTINFPSQETIYHLRRMWRALNVVKAGKSLPLRAQQVFITVGVSLWSYLTQYEGQCVDEGTAAVLPTSEPGAEAYMDVEWTENDKGEWVLICYAMRRLPTPVEDPKMVQVLFEIDPQDLTQLAAAVFSMLSAPIGEGPMPIKKVSFPVDSPLPKKEHILRNLYAAKAKLDAGQKLTVDEQAEYLDAIVHLWDYLTQYEGECIEEDTPARVKAINSPDIAEMTMFFHRPEHRPDTVEMHMVAFCRGGEDEPGTGAVDFEFNADDLKLFTAGLFGFLLITPPTTTQEEGE